MNENISTTINENPTLYLGNETTVTGKKWDFGNSNVIININGTQPNMVVNKSYVDQLVEIQEKKIDTILDGASVSIENFKNFVDFVNMSKRENEAELYNSINDISNNIITEINRATEFENNLKTDIENIKLQIDNNNGKVPDNIDVTFDEIKSSVQNEVNRATQAEQSCNTLINEVKSSLQNEFNRSTEFENNLKTDIDNIKAQIENTIGKVPDNIDITFDEIKSSVQNEVNRATEFEKIYKNDILEIKSSIQNQTNRSLDAINNIDNTTTDIKRTIQDEINRATNAEQTFKDLLNDFQNKIENLSKNNENDNSVEKIDIETKRAIDVEKSLEEKIEALYQYFFKSNSIPIQ